MSIESLLTNYLSALDDREQTLVDTLTDKRFSSLEEVNRVQGELMGIRFARSALRDSERDSNN